ncbi:MAG: superoxide dismutase [Gemmatimonadota bacterium]
MPFQLPDLPYGYDALEPHIDEQTMRIHHDKHHGGYTEKLNKALKGHSDLADKPIEEILADVDALPGEIRTTVRNNGGGFANHSLFWGIMSPKGGGDPTEDLGKALTESFGSLADFRDTFTKTATARFGSGWAWLVMNDEAELEVYSTPNQDSPLMEGHIPILGLDVWEHAYYLKYQNRRPDYIEAWWNLVNMEQVARNLETARSGESVLAGMTA